MNSLRLSPISNRIGTLATVDFTRVAELPTHNLNGGSRDFPRRSMFWNVDAAPGKIPFDLFEVSLNVILAALHRGKLERSVSHCAQPASRSLLLDCVA